MKLGRAIDIQNILQRNVADLVSSHKMFHGTHASLVESYCKLFDRYPKGLPFHVREYVRGYFAALVDSLYHTALTHGYEWQGTIYTEWEEYPEELKTYLREHNTDEITHGHYWADTLETKENRPFFVK
jgi:hypothetical protein